VTVWSEVKAAPKSGYDGFVKSSDAVLRCILHHCGVRQVRLILHDLRALPANLFYEAVDCHSLILYELIVYGCRKNVQ